MCVIKAKVKFENHRKFLEATYFENKAKYLEESTI